MLPGRVHSYQDGQSRYSVTVIDYSNIQKLHAQRLANCDKYPNLCNNPGWVSYGRNGLRRGGAPQARREGDRLRTKTPSG